MQPNEFHLKWERDEKFRLLEQVESSYDEASWVRAVELYENVLAKQPDNPEYLHSYGYLLELKANRLLRKAADCYQKGLESERLKQDFAWVGGKLHAQLIKARAQLLQNQVSVEFYKKQLVQNPDDPEMYCFLAQCYLNADQVNEARKVVESGLKLFSENATLNYYLGEVLSRLGHTEEALAAWEKSAVIDPQLIDGRFSRAFLLERERRLEESADEWKKIVEFMERYDFEDDFPKRELKRIESMLGN